MWFYIISLLVILGAAYLIWNALRHSRKKPPKPPLYVQVAPAPITAIPRPESARSIRPPPQGPSASQLGQQEREWFHACVKRYMLTPRDQTALVQLLLRQTFESYRDMLKHVAFHVSVISKQRRYYMFLELVEYYGADSFAARQIVERIRGLMEGESLDSEVYLNARDYLHRWELVHRSQEDSPAVRNASSIYNPFEAPQTPANLEPAPRNVLLSNLPQLSRRELENQEALLQLYANRQRALKRSRSLYESSEQVHETSINDSTLDACEAMIKQQGRVTPPDMTFEKLLKHCHNADSFKRAYNRIMVTDQSQFGYGFKFTLRDIFAAVLSFISKQAADVQETLLTILVRDLEEKSKKCGTGYMSAIIGCVQGFDNAPKITVDPSKEIYGLVKHRLDKYLSDEATDEVRDHLLDKDKSLIRADLAPFLATLRDEITREYEAIVPEIGARSTMITEAIDRYLG